MARGIKDKVAILGMGCSKFGERWDSGAEELMVEAYKEAIADAGIDPNQLDAAWFSTAIDEVHVGKSGIPLSTTLRLPNIPVTHVENLCASGTEAFRGAVLRRRLGRGRHRARARRREAEGHRLRRPAGRPRRPAAGAVERQRHGAGQLRPARHRLHDRARRLGRGPQEGDRPRLVEEPRRTAPRTPRRICRRPSRWTPS